LTQSQPQPIRVLGIDPGSRRLGWAMVQCGRPPQRLDSGVLTAKASKPVAQRLGILLGELERLLAAHDPDVLAIEQAFVYKNPKTALVIGQARGIPLALCAARDMQIYEYQPSVIKQTVVGSGRATKEQMRRMVQLQFELSTLPLEDEADALAVALTYAIGAARPVASKDEMTDSRSYYLAVTEAAKRRGGKRR